jgi:hypothetical protein
MTALHNISADELILRAAKHAGLDRKQMPRWAAVSRTFALGSTYSKDLCAMLSLDPDEPVGSAEVEPRDDGETSA